MDSTSPSSPPSPPPKRSGVTVIREHLKTLPTKPGVYRMFGEYKDLLYVGKAKSLKNRVSSYAQLGGHSQRIARMISLTRSMEFVVTASETEALLLEASLIKSLKPRFNILLRDDKSFPHILVRKDHEAPQVLKHRGARKIKGDYFGPFAAVAAVNDTLDTLQKAFHLRTCRDNIYANRTRPCMLHQMGRCAAPCTGEVSLEEYAELVAQAERFMRGEGIELQQQLSNDMDEASANREYEKAANYRDRIRALAAVRAAQHINPDGLIEADVFAIHSDAGHSCIQAFFFRAGLNWGATAYYPRHDRDDEPEQILTAFIAQFYDTRPVPKLILVSHPLKESDLLTQALELKSERKLEIRSPQRGDKKGVVAQATLNAKEALGRKLAETQSQQKILSAVQKVFELPKPPTRIEVYDNSHIQGTNMVGGMVVAGAEGFEKSSYRKFNIKDSSIEPGDDYGMMREVMRRRFSRLKKEAEEFAAERASPDSVEIPRPPTWPDLVLIDGGTGQLSAVEETIRELGFKRDELNLVAIAKGPDRNAGREQFFRPARAPFQLPQSDPALYYLQRLRDEAHRWAIGTHRAKRAKQAVSNPLDEIQGVGASRKKALLHHFGSAKAVGRATPKDLTAVDGISAALAQRIYDHFQKG